MILCTLWIPQVFTQTLFVLFFVFERQHDNNNNHIRMLTWEHGYYKFFSSFESSSKYKRVLLCWQCAKSKRRSPSPTISAKNAAICFHFGKKVSFPKMINFICHANTSQWCAIESNGETASPTNATFKGWSHQRNFRGSLFQKWQLRQHFRTPCMRMLFLIDWLGWFFGYKQSKR